jgi:hypothetical protein
MRIDLEKTVDASLYSQPGKDTLEALRRLQEAVADLRGAFDRAGADPKSHRFTLDFAGNGRVRVYGYAYIKEGA